MRRGSGLVVEVYVDVEVDVEVDVGESSLIQHEMLTSRLQMIL